MGKNYYYKYRYSDLEWLGEIPSQWQIKRAKWVFREIDFRSETGNEELLSVSEHFGVIKRKNAHVNMFQAASYIGYKLCNPGDLVINSLWAWSRGLGFSQYHGIISTAYGVYRPNPNEVEDYQYFHYLLRTKRYVGQYIIRSKGIWISRLQLSDKNFLDIPILLPPKEEQTAIARFLDYKLAKINRFIRKKKQLIKLINEQKAAIINQAVTQGLDPNAKMKDSGIEWLGEIPEHWEVQRLKFLIKGKLKYGANEPGGNFIQDAPRYIRITDFDNVGNLRNDTFCSLEISLAEPYLLKEGDILFARSGGTVGKTFQFKKYEGLACYAGYLIKAEPNSEKILSDYLFVYTNSGVYNQWKNFIFNKATIENIGADKYVNLPVILPKIGDQQAIVSYIEKETSIINTTISTIEKEIALVEEYKTALIAEAVTGKIDVRGYAVPKVEMAEENYEELQEEMSMAAEDGINDQIEEEL